MTAGVGTWRQGFEEASEERRVKRERRGGESGHTEVAPLDLQLSSECTGSNSRLLSRVVLESCFSLKKA